MSKNFHLIKRKIEEILPDTSERRIVLITGARQTGKTTLAKKIYSHLKYINLDSIENREILKNISTFNWSKQIGNAIIDEAQKEPSIFEKIKYSYDNGDIFFTLLLGSSQILILKKIRETLAGRIWIYELFPFLICELNEISGKILLEKVIDNPENLNNILIDEPVSLFEKDEKFKNTENFILKFGAMPPIIHFKRETTIKKWLKDYSYTYLERDLSDLARLDDLMPFRKLQQLSALRSAKLLNFSEIARDAGISVDTAKRYIEYLKISYQVILLYPYYKNITSSIIKTPKLYWLDIGLLRTLSNFWGEILPGELFENMVISEIYKYIKTLQKDVNIYFYRTRTGMEIDLILEIKGKILGIEIKNRENIVKSDYKNLKRIGEKLKNNWLGGIVIYRGNVITQLDKSIWAIPSFRLLN